MMTNKVADLESKLSEYRAYITANYGLREKVVQLVENRISKIKIQN